MKNDFIPNPSKFATSIKIAELLVEKYSISVTKTTIRKKFAQHTKYPVLHALSEALKEWRISTIVTRLTPEKLSLVAFPCIGFLKNTRGEYPVIITDYQDNLVSYIKSTTKTQTESLEDFCQKWNRVIIVLEITQDSGEAGNAAKPDQDVQQRPKNSSAS